MFYTVLMMFKGSSKDDPTNKRFNLFLISFFSFPNLLYYCCPVKRRQALLRSNLPRNNLDQRESRLCFATTFQGRSFFPSRMIPVVYAS